MLRLNGLLATALLALSIAPGASLAEDGTFTHEAGVDRFGYYFPPESLSSDSAPMVGSFRLEHFHIGIPEDMDKWESGDRPDPYAPVMFVFVDTSSPQVENEMGGTSYENSVRVLPTSYSVTASEVTFAGTDKDVGEVTLRAEFLSDEPGAGLRGDLTFGGETYEDVEFTYFGGD